MRIFTAARQAFHYELLERIIKLIFAQSSFGLSTAEQDDAILYSRPEREFYLVRGSNPLCIRHFPERGLYIYTSTENIVQRAQCRLRGKSKKGVNVPIEKGEVVMITPDGKTSRSHFTVRESEYPYNCARSGFITRYDYFHTAHTNRAFITQLKAVAQYYGFDSKEIDDMITEGFTLTEIEDMIYDTRFIGCF